MEEIYWLQRLGSINTLMWVMFGVGMGVLIVLIIVFLCNSMDDLVYDEEPAKHIRSFCKKVIKRLSPVVCVACLGGIFVPTTSEMYAIYGIGGTIDYLKENETAKQLPDKVINALDKWIDGLNKDKEK